MPVETQSTTEELDLGLPGDQPQSQPAQAPTAAEPESDIFDLDDEPAAGDSPADDGDSGAQASEPADAPDEDAKGPSPQLLKRAEAFGISADELKSYAKDQAERFIDCLEFAAGRSALQQQAAWVQQQQQAAWVQQQQQLSAAPATLQPGAQPWELKPITLGDDYGPEMKDLHSNVVGLHQWMQGELTQRQAVIDQMQQQMQMLGGYVANQIQLQRINAFDGFIAELGDDWADTLGKGGSLDLPADSQERKARDAIWDAQEAILAHAQMTQQPPPSPRELFNRARRMVYGDKIETEARRKVLKMVRDEQGRFTARPTHREMRSNLSPDERARRAVAAKLREKGLAG